MCARSFGRERSGANHFAVRVQQDYQSIVRIVQEAPEGEYNVDEGSYSVFHDMRGGKVLVVVTDTGAIGWTLDPVGNLLGHSELLTSHGKREARTSFKRGREEGDGALTMTRRVEWPGSLVGRYRERLVVNRDGSCEKYLGKLGNGGYLREEASP